MALNLGPLNVLLRLDGANKFQGQAQKSAGAIDGIGRAVAGLAAGFTIKQFVQESVTAFAEFERGMTRVGAVTNSLGSEAFAGLTKRAQELAATTEFTSRQVADAMGFMGMAGMKTNDIFASTPAVLQLASAGMVDVASAADTVTNIMAGYQFRAEELNDVNNVLVATFTNSNTSLQMLGESFKYAGPIAKASGVSFKEAAAMIGIMGNAGVQGSMAGTSLRNALLKLQAPTKEGAAIMRRFGIETKDASGKMKPLNELFRQFAPLAEDAVAMQELFGIRGMVGMQAALGQGADALDNLTKKIEGAGNIAERISQAQLETLDGKIKIMKSNFEAFQIAAGDAFGPMTTKMVENLTIVFGDLKDSVDGVGVGLLDSSMWDGFLQATKSVILTIASVLDWAGRKMVQAATLPWVAMQQSIGVTKQVLGQFLEVFKMVPGLGGIAQAGAAMKQEGKDQSAAISEFWKGVADSQPVQSAVEEFFKMFERQTVAATKSIEKKTAQEQKKSASSTAAKAMATAAPSFAPMTTGEQMAAVQDLFAGYDVGTLPIVIDATAEELERWGNLVGFASEEIDVLGEEVTKTAEVISRFGDEAAQAITQIGGAVVGGRAGATFGPQLGSMIGGAIAGALTGGAAAPVGSAIGGLLGGLFGDAFDELVRALGVLTPVFDLVAGIIKTLEAPLKVIGFAFKVLADMIMVAVGPVLEDVFGILAKMIYAVITPLQILAPIFGLLLQGIIRSGFLIMPVLDMLASAIVALIDGVLKPAFEAFASGYNWFIKFLNEFTLMLREIEILGAKPFATFGTLLDEISPVFTDYMTVIAAETEAREESTESLREFNEELSNVPIGIKRLQFQATRGDVFPSRWSNVGAW